MKKSTVIIVLGVAIAGGIWYRQTHIPSNATPLASPSGETETAIPSISLPPTDDPSTPDPIETNPVETSPPTKPVDNAGSGATKPAIAALLADSLPNLTIEKNKDGLPVVTNTSSLYVLVNKKRNLPANYEPRDLVVPDVAFSFSGNSPKKKMRKEAAAALEKLFKAAEKDGIELKAVSGYRSYATQKSIFENNANTKGEEVANRTSARPGQSEHQTGLAMDVSSASVGYGLEESFGKTKEGKWLAKHAADHGFIIRFMKGKETVTGYSYEPWHVRYVGKEVAKDITKKNVTLEEYFDDIASSINRKA
ncbi:M15 family metallopeptidase [Cohnella terricola]|uniref:M15 family metallopeptidase n=1 Tax=Cohnella terricola TaxID=1289167 RepID=A0A559JFY5_9BACL|nr:M15 family metallopeptidase [Cohnella terricola]TVX98783.1 M15 family metallopeptidase [Cohnella terricola]